MYYVTYTKPNPYNALESGVNVLEVTKKYKDNHIYTIKKFFVGSKKPDKNVPAIGISNLRGLVETRAEVIEKIFELELKH